MKLEVGMYVRTNDGYINKIKKVNQFNVLVYGRDLFGEELNIPNNEITKASYSIIDILEVGDYVNGSKVIEIEKDYKFIDGTIRDILWTDTKMQSAIWDETIKSIITKEQMEQMTYKVE